MTPMTEALAFFKIEAISDWKGYIHIMSKYVLQSAVPILFHDLLSRCSLLSNPEFNTYKLAQMNPYHKEFFKEDPELTKGESPNKENNAHQAIWTQILMKQLAEFSKLRLLGEQTPDMRNYHMNSYNYIRLMGMLFYHLELPGTQETILHYYLDMLRDYLLRNMPGLPANADAMGLDDLLQTCEDIYHTHSAYTKDSKGHADKHYVNFREGIYATALLNQIKGIALHEKDALKQYPNLGFHLSNVELLYTFILYAYMVEFACYNSPESTPVQKKFNLINQLGNIEYHTQYKDYLQAQSTQDD